MEPDPPSEKRYWSERQGRGPAAGPPSFEELRDLAFIVIDQAIAKGFLIEAFGHDCPDADDEERPGYLGDVVERMHHDLRRRNVWPHREHAAHYDIDALFDVIEFVYQHASEPSESWWPVNCDHRHWTGFDRDAGRAVFRDEINKILRLAENPVVLGVDGDITYMPDQGFDRMLDADLPASTPSQVQLRVEAAIRDYRASRSEDDLRHAVRDLTDALENVRTSVKAVLDTGDERALFKIFNTFGIRHLKDTDRLDYRPPFLRWLFYVSLATIHLTLRMADAEAADAPVQPEIDVSSFWARVLKDLEWTAPAVRGFLDGSRVIELANDALLVWVTSEVRRSMLINPDNIARVEASVERVIGRRLAFDCTTEPPAGA